MSLQVDALRGALEPLVPVYPWIVFGAGVLLGWRFHRLQPILALVLLLAAERTLATFADAGAAPADRAVTAAVALLLPLDLAVLAWHSERSLRAGAGRLTLALLLIQPLAVVLVRQPELESLARALDAGRAGGPGLRGAALTQPELLAFGAALALASARFALRQTLIQSGFLWALLAAFLAVGAGTGLAATVYLTTGGLVLVLALVETSHHMAYDDELTGLPGRRAFEDALLRLGGQFAIAMLDIDHFKRFNDEHGHDAGDQLLRMVGATLTRTEGGGRAFRYGGEEFAILFPGRSAVDALPHLEALRRAIEATGFTLRGRDRPTQKPKRPVAAGPRRKLSVTVSIGVAESDGGEADPREVVKAADRALYRAKGAGRNRVVCAG
ncbi:MAG: hypothetical protein A3E31_16625 [Candidatus Rokubacteria bacterium RIFCSPHIGHO2_12_FULL_73_22]|nr:MAG: hypothetical protein A3E31_16625 [Candidatus Rokubacteria bacterium RIFCSPHIGHO2_12_FULL_73_22]OGL13283.1 MAG: hypothetical protein A3I14_00160 [Candidatus Rokubacteria bacterium RIFCSPLOWO2_02_FULL_73_56]